MDKQVQNQIHRGNAKLCLCTAIVMSALLLYGCESCSSDAPIGKTANDFEKWCQQQQMTVTSSSEEQLFLRGERRKLTTVYCSGGGAKILGAEAYALDSTVYSVVVNSAAEPDSQSTFEVFPKELRTVRRESGRHSVTEWKFLVDAGVLSKDSTFWEMGPDIAKTNHPLPSLFHEPLRTFGPVALGMSSAAFKAAMANMKVGQCIEEDFSYRRKQLLRDYERHVADQKRMLVRLNQPLDAWQPPPAPIIANHLAIGCGQNTNTALFLDDKLYMYRSKLSKSKEGQELRLLHRVAQRGAAASTDSAVVVVAGGNIQKETAKAMFFGGSSVLATLEDENDSIFIVGDTDIAKKLCLEALYNISQRLGAPHPACVEAFQLVSLVQCPTGTIATTSFDGFQGTFVYEETCNVADAKEGFPSRTWIGSASGAYLLNEQESASSPRICYNEPRQQISCAEQEKLFSGEAAEY